MNELTKEHWVKKLDLLPHPEGGFYKQTFRSENTVTVPGKFETPHSTGTEIYFLLGSPTNGDFSAWHTINNLEETWHFHYGKDVVIHIIDSQGNYSENRLGLGVNASFQVHVPANSWFCAVVDSENQNDYSLVGCSVFPGFDFKDFELGDKNILSSRFPEQKHLFEKYTRANQLHKKIVDLASVDALLENDILDVCIKNLQSYDAKLNVSQSSFHSEVDSPEKTLKKKLGLLVNSNEDGKKDIMIKEIESSDIDLDLFAKICTQLKEQNSLKKSSLVIDDSTRVHSVF